MKYFDAHVSIGRDVNLDPFQCSDIGSVRRMLDKYRIEKAFLVSFASYCMDFVFGNEMTFDAAGRDPRLIPCPTVVPDSGGEVGDHDRFVGRLVERGARCVGFYPKICGTSLDRRVVGALFKAIEERRLPVMIPADQLDLEPLAALSGEYPRIPFIYSAVPYRHRNLMPFLRDFRNIHLTISAPFALNEGIEQIVRQVGSRQLLFASDFPVAEPGVSVSYLNYAQIGKADRKNIAFMNMGWLIRGVRRV